MSRYITILDLIKEIKYDISPDLGFDEPTKEQIRDANRKLSYVIEGLKKYDSSEKVIKIDIHM